MSYDVYLRDAAGEHIDFGGDRPGPTYNLTPIFDRALTGEPLPNADVGEAGVVLFGQKTDRPRGLRLLSGRRAGDTIEWMQKALGHLDDPAQRQVFRELEPENGWGDIDGARRTFRRMIQIATGYPDGTWDIR